MNSPNLFNFNEVYITIYSKEHGKKDYTYSEYVLLGKTDKQFTPHRVGGPAKIWNNGDRVWMRNGAPHRVDGPAYIYTNGLLGWYICGLFYSATEYYEVLKQIREMPLVLRLTDPRWWVREFEDDIGI